MSPAISSTAPQPGLETLGKMLSQLPHQRWTAKFQGLRLHTALQPIFSISHKRIVGYEALIRAFNTDESVVHPEQLFALPASDAESVLLDRLCRYLHVQNFAELSDDTNWLFLNVSPQTIASGARYDSFFGQLLKATRFPSHRVVVEIVEQPTDDMAQLRETVDYYRSLGCLTAIDDFGAGHSNFERIWNLKPDIVKLDRQMLTRAIQDKQARQILNGIVSLLHQSGCMVLLEGVESRDQALLAVDTGVDFVQGYFFQTPSTELHDMINSASDFESLLQDYKDQVRQSKDPRQSIIEHFSEHFGRAISALLAGQPVEVACQRLLTHHLVSRCYLIGQDGIQQNDPLLSPTLQSRLDPRFRPLENTACADWCRQQPLRKALFNPGRLQVTQPYLSVTGAHMCVTLSCAFEIDNGDFQVLCCDIFSS